MYKKLKEHLLTLIILITFLLDLGVIQPINHEPTPEPVPYRFCVPEPPAKTCMQWV
ncbi:hypothetical protein D3C85_1540990 [compost metagenome]